MANDDTKPGFWGWAQKHWFLTFLLAGSALAIPANIISAARAPATPAGPPPNPNQGPAAPFKAGDLVAVDVFRGQLGIAGMPTGTATVRIDQLQAPGDQFAQDFMGTVTSPVQGTVSQSIPRSAVIAVVQRI